MQHMPHRQRSPVPLLQQRLCTAGGRLQGAGMRLVRACIAIGALPGRCPAAAAPQIAVEERPSIERAAPAACTLPRQQRRMAAGVPGTAT